MIIELQPGDWAQVVAGAATGEYAEIVSSLDGHGYHTVALGNGEQWDIPAYQLSPVIEIAEDEEPPEDDNQSNVPPFGMTSNQVAQYAEKFLAGCLTRIEGVGNEQYSRQHYQKFETMNPLEVLDAVEEEILDIPNYCVFLYILIQRMKNGIGEAALG